MSQVSLSEPGFPQVLRLEKPAYGAARGSRWTREDDPLASKYHLEDTRLGVKSTHGKTSSLLLRECLQGVAVAACGRGRGKVSGTAPRAGRGTQKESRTGHCGLADSTRRSPSLRLDGPAGQSDPGIHRASLLLGPEAGTLQVPIRGPGVSGPGGQGRSRGAPASSEFFHFKAGQRQGRRRAGGMPENASICFVRVGDQ